MIIFLLASGAVFAQSEVEQLKAQMAELQEQVDDLTFRSYTRYFTLSGSLKNHYESYQAKFNPGESDESEDTINTLSSIFALNVNFNVNDRLKVYTKFGMSKFWNYDGNNQAGTGRQEPLDSWDSSNTGSWGLDGSTPRIDRAYMSYNTPGSNLTFAIGRLPTNSGPPVEKSEGLERQGTYPRFAYNAIFDGMGVAYNASHLVSKGDSLNARFFYSPFVNIDQYDRRSKREEDGEVAQTLTPQYTFQVEYVKNEISFAERMHAMFFLYNYANFFQWETEDPDDDSDGYVSYYDATAQSFYLGFDNIASTNFSLNASYLYVRSLYSEAGGSARDTYGSHATLVNSTYNLGERKIIGLEYIKTDENFYIDDFNYYFLADFYKAENNEGLHLSYNQPLYSNLDAKFGVFSYRKKPGSVDDSRRDVNSFYTTLTANF